MSECIGICEAGDVLLRDNKVPAIPMCHFALLRSLEDMHMQRSSWRGLYNPCTRLRTNQACRPSPLRSPQKSGFLLDLVRLHQPGCSHQSRRRRSWPKAWSSILAFRLTFTLLLVLGALCRNLGFSSLSFELGIGPLGGWLSTAGARRLLSARMGASLEIVRLRATP